MTLDHRSTPFFSLPSWITNQLAKFLSQQKNCPHHGVHLRGGFHNGKEIWAYFPCSPQFICKIHFPHRKGRINWFSSMEWISISYGVVGMQNSSPMKREILRVWNPLLVQTSPTNMTKSADFSFIPRKLLNFLFLLGLSLLFWGIFKIPHTFPKLPSSFLLLGHS